MTNRVKEHKVIFGPFCYEKYFILILSVVLFLLLIVLCVYVQNGLMHFSRIEWDNEWLEKISGPLIESEHNSFYVVFEESQESQEVYHEDESKGMESSLINSEPVVESAVVGEIIESSYAQTEEDNYIPENEESSYNEESSEIIGLPELSEPEEAEDTGRENELPIG